MNKQKSMFHARPIYWSLAAASALIAASCSSQPSADSPTPDEDAENSVETTSQALGLGRPGGGFKGTARLSYAPLGTDILPLPDVSIYAQNVVTGTTSARVKSDLFGRFYVPPQASGFYKVCWEKANYVSQCTSTVYNVTSGDLSVDYLSVAPIDVPRLRVRGKVALADGGLCLSTDKFFGVTFSALAEVIQGGAVLVSSRANSEGEFFLAGIPTVDATLRVSCGTAEVLTSLSANLDLTGGKPADFTIGNHRPFIAPITAALAGQDARAGVAPLSGIALSSLVTDPDGDDLKFHWKVPQGAGTLADTATTTATWKLPGSPGTFFAYLSANDGKGGFVTRRVGVRVRTDGATEVVFSGSVIGDTTRKPIKGALVSVGKTTARTDANGDFAVSVPQDQSYIFGIENAGYAEYSRRLLTPARGQVYVLTEAFKQIINPAVDNVIVDKRPRWIEGSQKSRRGGQVFLPANSLLLKPPPVLPLTANIVTFDPTSEVMPGDFTATNGSAKSVGLLSYGAVFIEIRDATGRKYNLDPAKTAEVDVPVQNDILGSEALPAAMPNWTFDMPSGTWQELPGGGKFTGNSYRMTVNHFSTKNADVEKAAPACVRVQLDPTLPTDGSLSARIDVTIAPGSVRRYEVTLDNENNVLYNLPTGAPYTLEVFDGTTLKLTLPGNTGGAWGGVSVPPYPYSVCDTKTVEAGAISTGAINFLTFKQGTSSAANANNYYSAIDPSALRDNLKKFWTKNSFGADGSGGTRTFFLNHNDIGFGRDMHCLKTGANVACYDTNYGEPDQAPGNFALAQTASKPSAWATVAMEYSAVEGQSPTRRIVKFYVYNGGCSDVIAGCGATNSVRINSADLDKSGPKFIPNLCLNCHGGDYTNPAVPNINQIDMGASFREFDIYSYRDGTPREIPVGTARIVAQEAQFFAQNQLVKNSAPVAAISELVDLFYPTGAVPFDPNALPCGWRANTAGPPCNGAPAGTGDVATETFYHDVVAKSCRTCHVAFEPNKNWNTFNGMKLKRASVSALVCGAHLMPHANVTFKNFWLSSPSEPAALGAFTTAGWPAIGTCSF